MSTYWLNSATIATLFSQYVDMAALGLFA